MERIWLVGPVLTETSVAPAAVKVQTVFYGVYKLC